MARAARGRSGPRAVRQRTQAGGGGPSDGWVDESQDPAPPSSTSVLDGVDLDSVGVDGAGHVVWPQWGLDHVGELPDLTVGELQAVARAQVPGLDVQAAGSTCANTASAGEAVTVTAHGFARRQPSTMRLASCSASTTP